MEWAALQSEEFSITLGFKAKAKAFLPKMLQNNFSSGKGIRQDFGGGFQPKILLLKLVKMWLLQALIN